MTWNGVERRQYTRVTFACKVHIVKAIGTLELMTEDISAGGMRVTLARQMEQGTPVELELFLPQRLIACKGYIAWTAPKQNGASALAEVFTTGIRFSGLSDGDKQYLQDLTARFGSGT